MKVRFDQVKQIGEEITRQSLSTLAEVVVTDRGPQSEKGKLTSAVVVFNPSSNPRTDLVEIEINLPAGVDAFDLVDDKGETIPHESLGIESADLANLILDRKGLREAMTMINDGRVSGMGVQSFESHRDGATLYIEILLSDAEPILEAWQRGVREVTSFLDVESITSFHVRARTLPSNKIIFPAPQIPGLGYRTFHIRSRSVPESKPTRLNPAASLLMPLAKTSFGQKLIERFTSEPAPKPPYMIENDFFIAEANSVGTLTLTDKRDGAVYPGLNRFMDTGDRGDEYNYCPVEKEPGQGKIAAKLWGVKINRSEVRQTLEIALELTVPTELNIDRKSRSSEFTSLDIITKISLSPGIPRVDVHTEVENHARDHRLRVHFPTGLNCNDVNEPVSADFDGHFEVVRRAIGEDSQPATDPGGLWIEQPRPEVPQRAFTDVSGGNRGLMIANRGLPEVEVLKREDGTAEIALTLLRCVGWLSRDDLVTRPGHAGPGMETPDAQMPGTWTFDYAVIPHVKGQTSPYPLSYNFEVPLRAAATGLHYGSLPPSGSFIDVESTGFVISSIKETEDGRGWLVRGTNMTSNPLPVSIRPWKPFKSVEFSDLAERRIRSLDAPSGGRITVNTKPYEIVTLVFCD
jgi:mannosylglycerate hydrolase